MSAAAKFTPGPWRLSRPSYKGLTKLVCGGSPERKIANVNIGDDVGLANANLIAAAPDLYAALRCVLDAIGALSNPGELYALVGDKSENVLAALAKAGGTSS